MAAVSLLCSLCRTLALCLPAPLLSGQNQSRTTAPAAYRGPARSGPPIFSGNPGVERGRQYCGRCLVTPPSWRAGASAPRQGTWDGQKGGQAALCALITTPAPPQQRSYFPVALRGCIQGGSGMGRGSGLSFASCRNPPFPCPRPVVVSGA